jgi:copper(I)-binding protein
MRKWIIASLLGVAIISAVYFLWATREKPSVLQAPPSAPAKTEGALKPSLGQESASSSVSGEATEPSATAPATSDETETAEATEPTGSVTIDNAWARESTPQGVTAVYMVMILVADDADRLKSARSSAAESVEIHETRIEGGVMTMHRIDQLDVEPDTPVVFEPGGLHLMVIGLKRPLKTGDSLPLVLEFAHAGKLTLEVPVGEPAGTDALGHGGDE